MAHTVAGASTRRAAQAIARETRLIREAIAMVAAGGSPRVILAGIRHGEELLDMARRDALAAGVRVNPIRRPANAGTDLIVEPIYE
jgi:hypothetical protein